jgi:hypothetical protein
MPVSLTFKEEIAKIVLDKLLIGLLLAGAALGGSLLIEQYKANSSITVIDSNEFMRRVDSAWAAAYEYEAAVNQIACTYQDWQREEEWLPEHMHTPRDVLQAKIDHQEAVAKVKRAQFFDLLDKNAFYLGDKIVEHLTMYVNLSHHLANREVELFRRTYWADTLPDSDYKKAAQKSVDEMRESFEEAKEATRKSLEGMRFNYATARLYSLGQPPR